MYFRDIRTVALLSHFNGVIGDDELGLLYELYKSKNPHLKYWDNIEFDLDLYTDEEFQVIFRFKKNDIYQLADVLDLPEEVH